jgi:gliding motility-associated-like protein
MLKFYCSSKYILLSCILFSAFLSFSQATIKVTVTSVQTSSSVDCDGIGFGDSDFVWEYTATDNTLGYSNNSPALFGVYNFNYTNVPSGNGPINFAANSLFFDRQYICPSDVPTTINLAWEAYDNDDGGPYDILGFANGETGLVNVQMAVPPSNGIANYSFTASGASGCPAAVNYIINLTVERINFVPTVIILPDDICNATLMNLNTSYNVALCQSNTLQPNEPRGGDVQSNNSSAWFRFVAPASGSVEVSTDNGGTEIGTYFQIYHAADGSSCNTGLQPLTGAVIKDKFEYLSHIEFSDGIDLLGVDPEAQLSLDACDPFPGISYQKLIAGETYYVQLTSDDQTAGLVEVRINDLDPGGSSAGDSEDIPCLSSTVTFTQNPISSAASSAESVVLDFGCAYDGGNDYAETGAPHTDNNPIHYHAYDYDHNNVSINNPVVNESVWLNFVAPNSGRIVFESDYQSSLYGENNALFGFDKRFSPGVPSDYSCANLEFLAADAGGTNSFLGGGDISALIDQRCLEPGYTYYGMVDPSDNLTPLSSQNIKSWVFDPSISNPNFNSPGNDILCLTLQNPLYEVPVILASTNPTFQAVAGSNVFACQEYLAGEPNADPTPANVANQTVWHYFTAPPSGAVEMSIRAYIGMDVLRYNVYELLNGTDCYGGLGPATYTEDGTRNTPIVTPIISGTAGFTGTQQSACCLEPGKLYAIQIDGGSPGDEGQYIIEYIQEIDSDAGDIFVEMQNGDSLTLAQQDTAFVCFGESILAGITVNGIGESTQSFPDCLSPGYVIHQVQTVADPIANTGFENAYIDSIISPIATFTNNGDGSGSFGNPLFNTLYYISPAGDITTTWGDFTCGTSTVSNGLPIVFLEPLMAEFDYDNVSCTAIFSASGGLNGYYDNPYSYTITSPSGSIVANGTLALNVSSSYTGSEAGIYTVEINDGACPQIFTFDATNCNNPCTPVTINIDTAICQGESILLGGAQQTESGIYTDVFITTQGCDSTVITNLSINPIYQVTKEHDLCPGGSIQIGSSTYSNQGVYVDTFQSVSGCDSIVTSVIFMLPTITSTIEATICAGLSYDFNGTPINDEGVYSDTLSTLDGCDSIVILSLFVTSPTVNYEVAEICQGEVFVFGNLNLDVSGIYTDTVQTSSGCDSLNILELSVVDCEFQISNILTPNDDGQNDTWKVSDVSKITGCDVRIYNRWGELVYQTNDYNNQWAGTRNNEQLPDGVYFYSIKCSDSEEYTGEINLLRFKK